MLSDKDMRERMVNGWRGGKRDGTICGCASTIGNTRKIAAWLPDVCNRYDILSLNDAGAGDMHWIKHIQWDIDYKPFDLIPRLHSIKKLDITKKKLPKCDAILCRMVLNHLGNDRTALAINLFRKSAKYLIATHFVGNKRSRGFTSLDLTKWLGEPVEICSDGHEPNCKLALWEL